MKGTEQTATPIAPALEDISVTIDCLAHYVARHLEDGASHDPETRRRYGRLVGLLAEHAERSCAHLRILTDGAA